MNRLQRLLVILIFISVYLVNVFANTYIDSQTRFRIEKLSTPSIEIGKKIYKQGDIFLAGEEIKWTDAKQSMLVKNISTSELIRFSRRISEKKGMLKSILELYMSSNKGSSRGVNDHIRLESSSKANLYPDKRIALIIGNQNYRYLAPLKCAQKDAEDLSETLEELGFDIIELYETDYTDLLAGINKFSGLARDYDVAVVYFAGHGIQEDGINYLVPVDNMLERRTDLRDCISCNEVVEKVEDSGCGSRIFYFDACRDRKTTWSRGSANGLATMEGAPGTVIVFAAEAGKTASDGERDGNSPFAESLIKSIKLPSNSFSEMLDCVVRDTYSLTNTRQYPIRIGTLISDFRFNNLLQAEGNLKATFKVSLEDNQLDFDVKNDSLSLDELYKKGYNYYYGENGVQKDYGVAFVCFKLAAEKGYSSAQNMLGIMYRSSLGVDRDYSEALKWCHKSAEQGNADGQYSLGYMYRYGHGAEENYEEAVKWYLKSAEQGNMQSQFDIGVMYASGLGVEKDFSKAMKWFLKASEQGSIAAMKYIGGMYENGEGVAKDMKEAKKWYEKAEERRLAEIKKHMETIKDDYMNSLKEFIH